LLICLKLPAKILTAAEATEVEKIEWLIAEIESMDQVEFIRNGKEYSSKDAARHMRLKWEEAGKLIRTVDDFVDICASRSWLSGKPYLIRYPDGSIIQSFIFFRRLLQEFSN